MAGLLDFIKTPEGQGLLSAAFAGMAGAQRGTPWNNVGRAGVAGLMGYSNTIDRQQNEEKNALYNEQARMQLDELKRKNVDSQREREILQGLYGQQGLPQSPIPQGYGLTDKAPVSFDKQPALLPPKSSQFEQYKAIGDKMASAGLVDKAQQYYGMAERFRPKYSTTPQKMVVGGKLTNVLVSEDGSVKTLDGYDVPPEMVSTDLGNRVVWSDKNAIQPGQALGKTMTPSDAANFGLARQKFAYEQSKDAQPKYVDGVWVIPPSKGQPTGAVVETPYAAPPKGSAAANVRSANKTLGLVDEAEKLLNKATGSYVGAGIDTAASVFGASTEGAKATAQLRALEGSLIQSMPRMEGPQSDKDVALYRQAAGMIGDHTIPVETRKAAIAQIRSLQEKYASDPLGSGRASNTFDADKERRYQEWKARQGK